MSNRARGEAELAAGGRVYRLTLTLGALAEIEDELQLADLSEVETRLKKLKAADLAIIAAALIRGGGQEMTPLDALRLPVPLETLVQAVARAFGGSAAMKGEGDTGHPFAGMNGSKSDSA